MDELIKHAAAGCQERIAKKAFGAGEDPLVDSTFPPLYTYVHVPHSVALTWRGEHSVPEFPKLLSKRNWCQARRHVSAKARLRNYE